MSTRAVTIAPDFGGYWRVMRGGVALMTGLSSEAKARRWAESQGWEVRPDPIPQWARGIATRCSRILAKTGGAA